MSPIYLYILYTLILNVHISIYYEPYAVLILYPFFRGLKASVNATSHKVWAQKRIQNVLDSSHRLIREHSVWSTQTDYSISTHEVFWKLLGADFESVPHSEHIALCTSEPLAMLQAISWPSRSCHRIRNSRETSKKTEKHAKHAFSWSEAERLGSNQTRCLALCQATSHSDISHMLISRKDLGDEEAVFDVFFWFSFPFCPAFEAAFSCTGLAGRKSSSFFCLAL